jgi:hypothetical protein
VVELVAVGFRLILLSSFRSASFSFLLFSSLCNGIVITDREKLEICRLLELINLQMHGGELETVNLGP